MLRLLRFGMVEAVATTIDDLLDREKRDQNAGEGDRGIKRGDRCIRWQSKTAKTAEKIEIAVVDQAGSHYENNQPNNQFGGKTCAAAHRFRYGGEVEVIIAAGGDRRTDENSIDE